MNWLQTSICAGVISLLPGVSVAFTAWNGARVAPISDTVFEVTGGPINASPSFWCAAGDYARRVLNAPLQQRLFVVGPRGPGVTEDRKSAVQFSFFPPEGVAPQGNVLLSVSQLGNNLSVAAAWSYCAESRRAYN